jgi:hypothetical protein
LRLRPFFPSQAVRKEPEQGVPSILKPLKIARLYCEIPRRQKTKAATNDTNFLPIRVIRGCLKKAIDFHA